MDHLELKRRRILDGAETVFRRQGKSRRTVKSYIGWIRRFFAYYPDRAPVELGEHEVTAYLNNLVMVEDVAESTQKQALCALKALYRSVYRKEFPWLEDLIRPKRTKRDPEVLTRGELEVLRAHLSGVYLIIFYVLFGSGLRLHECMTLRIKDVDLNRGLIHLRCGKGNKDRITVLAKPVLELLSCHMSKVYRQHQRDLARGAGHVELPHALARKYPNASREWRYQWLFPATSIYQCQETGELRRHHLHDSAVQRKMKAAVMAAGITKKCTPHTLRHSFAVHYMDHDPDMRHLQTLMGHKDIRTTMGYARIRRAIYGGLKSPADDL